MRTLHIIGWTAGCKANLVSPPHVPVNEQMKIFAGFRSQGIPDDLVRCELVDSERGVCSVAFPKPKTISDSKPKLKKP